jgi:hypothetical protein
MNTARKARWRHVRRAIGDGMVLVSFRNRISEPPKRFDTQRTPNESVLLLYRALLPVNIPNAVLPMKKALSQLAISGVGSKIVAMIAMGRALPDLAWFFSIFRDSSGLTTLLP